MESSLISIVITTFNRQENLRRLLGHLCAIRVNVPVHLFDNGSDFETIKIAMDAKSHLDSFYYHRLGVNSGFDGNMAFIVNSAGALGEYSIWLADDDFMDFNYLPNMARLIQQHNPDFMQFGFARYRFKGNEIEVDVNYRGIDGGVEIFSSPIEYFNKHWVGVPWYCGFVVCNRLLAKVNSNKYRGTFHAYAGYILDYLSAKYQDKGEARILFVKEMCPRFYLNHDDDQRTWSSADSRVFIGIRDMLAELPPLYWQSAREMWRKSYRGTYFGTKEMEMILMSAQMRSPCYLDF